MDINSVNMTGRLCRDADLLGDNKVCKMRIAVEDGYMKDGKWVEKAHFFDVVRFSPTDYQIDNLKKGARVALTGRLTLNEWVDKEGGKRSGVEIITSMLTLVDRGVSGGQAKAPLADTADDDDDDVPF